MSYNGGYLIERLPLLRADVHRHTSDLINPLSQETLDAVNAVQATPWRINRWLLDIMGEAYSKGLTIGGLPQPARRPSLERMDDAEYEAMLPEAKLKRIRERREQWSDVAKSTSHTQSILDQLVAAERMRDVPQFWFPHGLDFRHRIYPSPTTGPQPQGDDRSKALLMFATGLPLGEDGLFWLCVRAANCAGKDKLSLVERVEWTLSQRERITLVAADPIGTSGWWGALKENGKTVLDDPWQFLATAHELAQAWAMDNPEAFLSHLSIPLDGSCNGLQHLAALGLDPVGAAATNLMPGPRQDIYSQVAELVRQKLQAEATAGSEDAAMLLPAINRNTVKRAVMTTPYGVTSRGIREQLIGDDVLPGGFDDKPRLANLLGPLIEQSVGETVANARDIMEWLQGTAKALAKVGQPFEWITPTGSRVRQSYYVLSEVRVVTLQGSLGYRVRAPGGNLSGNKQASGAAPNFIHSFDAAHAAMTVNACHASGMRSFSMIHDSFGSHACHATEMGAVLRQKFVDIYRTDWLKKTYAQLTAMKSGASLPPPPPRGDFDITKVLESEFFFS